MDKKLITKSKMSSKARAWMFDITSRDTDEVLYREEQSDLAKITFAKSIYQGYKRAKENSGASLNHFCFILSTKTKTRPPAYYRNWYNIYRHFCIKSGLDLSQIVGLDYKMLKLIAETSEKIMDWSTTQEIVKYLTDTISSSNKKWKFVLDFIDKRKKLINKNELKNEKKTNQDNKR
jgi:hypothetical protein